MPLSDLGTLTDIPLDELLIDHEFNHRGVLTPIDVAAFAADLKRDGLRTPITVQPWTDPKNPKIKYRVVAGHRRAMAFRLLHNPSIPGFVKQFVDELAARKDSLIENLHRKDLNIKQEAHAMKPFVDAFWSEQEIADRLGQSRGWVKVRLMLLTLPEKIQNIAAAGLITQEHIKMLQGKSEEQQYAFVREVKEATARGEKLHIDKPVKKTNPHALKPRGREEIFAKIGEIYAILGEMGLWSRGMSWCAGQISEYELMKEVEKWAIDNGHSYRIPHEMVMAKFGE